VGLYKGYPSGWAVPDSNSNIHVYNSAFYPLWDGKMNMRFDSRPGRHQVN